VTSTEKEEKEENIIKELDLSKNQDNAGWAAFKCSRRIDGSHPWVYNTDITVSSMGRVND
jgi:hypothetical protein